MPLEFAVLEEKKCMSVPLSHIGLDSFSSIAISLSM